MPSERKYPLAKTSWRVRPSALVTIVTDDSRRIATFPLQFITDGGSNTWRYVIEVVEMLVDHDPQLPSLISDANGVAMLPHNAPTAGEFVYTQPGRTTPLEFSRGPEYFLRVAPPNVEGSSTRSRSSRSDVDQSRFKMFVIARDAVCLVTDAIFPICVAAHIVPQSRPDIYRQLQQVTDNEEPELFDVTCGLLLRKDLHHAFDRLEFSFFKDGDSYYVHAFNETCIPQHGKRIPPDRFHGPADWRPDPDLIAWHYKQCVKARIRGFSVGMAIQ